MHEVRVTVPRGSGSAIAKAALEAGIQRITICPVQVIDSHADAEIVSVETSTPRAKAFLHRVLSSGEVNWGRPRSPRARCGRSSMAIPCTN